MNEEREALQAFVDAYDAQWGDIDVWLDFLGKAREQAGAVLAKPITHEN